MVERSSTGAAFTTGQGLLVFWDTDRYLPALVIIIAVLAIGLCAHIVGTLRSLVNAVCLRVGNSIIS